MRKSSLLYGPRAAHVARHEGQNQAWPVHLPVSRMGLRFGGGEGFDPQTPENRSFSTIHNSTDDGAQVDHSLQEGMLEKVTTFLFPIIV